MKNRMLLLLLLLPLALFGQRFNTIKRYQSSFALALRPGENLLAWRSFVADGQKYLLLLDPNTLDTKVGLANNYKLSNLAYGNVQAIFKSSVYVKALNMALLNDRKIQNAGIDHAIPNEKGIVLTIDLCPSHQALDRVIFQSLIDAFKKIEQPVPLAISLSGKWILKHQADLAWLKNLVARGELDITWINHSYHHEINSLPLAQNFLLAKGTDMDVEVLANEQLMLQNGLVPSVFFRFPGLVSDQSLVEKVTEYGLIPIGSDAWLAKGQSPGAGSIVLIHGNGNEEIGVHDFIELLKAKKLAVKNQQWLLFDLRRGLDQALK